MQPDTTYLQQAIDLSLRHMQAGDGGPFGAVVVRGESVISEGWNQVTSSNDPTAHAEVVAIRLAASNLRKHSLEGCTLYASCEPCPMCLAAAYWARVDRVVYAATREDAAEIGFDDRHLYTELALPIEQRHLPMEQKLRDEALKVFGVWMSKEDRIPY